MTYDRSASYGDANVTVENIAYPLTPMGLHEDKLKLQVMDGIINITNISQEDIAGEICIYYKNAADDIYYGGITYRSTISGGLKAGELRQIQAAHYRQTGSEIMFVTIGE